PWSGGLGTGTLGSRSPEVKRTDFTTTRSSSSLIACSAASARCIVVAMWSPLGERVYVRSSGHGPPTVKFPWNNQPALEASLPREAFKVVHGRGDLLAVALLVLHPDHGAQRQIGPPHHAGRHDDLRAVVEHQPLRLEIDDAALDDGSNRRRRSHSRACGHARAQRDRHGKQRPERERACHSVPSAPSFALGRYRSGT